MGWWPFEGNVNDESGNGYHGSISNGILTADRNLDTNSAYLFVPNTASSLDLPLPTIDTNFSISIWAKSNRSVNTVSQTNLCPGSVSVPLANSNQNWLLLPQNGGNNLGVGLTFGTNTVMVAEHANNLLVSRLNSNALRTNFVHIVLTYSFSELRLYIDGQLVNSKPMHCTSKIKRLSNSFARSKYSSEFSGIIDDIGVWDRVLTQQEVTTLYNAVNCANNTTITSQTNSLNISSIAIFTATTSDLNPSYVWQCDFGQGFQSLNNYRNYSGVNTPTLNIANIQLSEHNLPIRVISSSGNCIDTSNVAAISILDTCLFTSYDTLLTTVADTLVINAQITGNNPPINLNTLKVFPNPAKTHITINYGNFNAMSGYTLTIMNSIGQTVFTTPINQQTAYIDLSSWTGNGIYFLKLIDQQNNTIEIRKIMIQ